MITLVNLFGFLIQFIVCPLVMIPWLVIRLLVSRFNDYPDEPVNEYVEFPTPAFG